MILLSPLQSCSVAPTKTKKKTTTKHTSKTAPTNAVAMVTEIIRTFVDAVPHIPGHRKHLLFSHLIRTMGAEDYLHVALGLLVEKQVVQSTAAGNREDRQVRTMRAEDYLHVGLLVEKQVVQSTAAGNREVRTMGAEDYLHVGLLVEKQVVQSTAAGNREVRTMGAEDYLHVALAGVASCVRETSGAINSTRQQGGSYH